MKRCAELYGNIQKSGIKSLDDNNLDAIDKLKYMSVDSVSADFERKRAQTRINEATGVVEKFNINEITKQANRVVDVLNRQTQFAKQQQDLYGGKPCLIK